MGNDVVAIIQARLTSSRLPWKVLARIGGHEALSLMLARLARSTRINRVVIAIPEGDENRPLFEFLSQRTDCLVVIGSEQDVLARFMRVVELYPADRYLRLTADCPFICPEIIDRIVGISESSGAWYTCNTFPATFPDGFDVECLLPEALVWLDVNAVSARHREHATLKFYEDAPEGFFPVNVVNPRGDLSGIRLTLDTAQDLDAINRLASSFGFDGSVRATASELEDAYMRLGLSEVNGHLRRNEATDFNPF